MMRRGLKHIPTYIRTSNGDQKEKKKKHIKANKVTANGTFSLKQFHILKKDL